jgi:hypothetical protein
MKIKISFIEIPVKAMKSLFSLFGGFLKKPGAPEGGNDKFNYVATAKELAVRGDKSGIAELTRRAFQDKDANEIELAFVAGIVFEKKVESAFNCLGEFVHRFPDSRQTIRVYLAGLLIQLERYDEAASNARYYLRLLKDDGSFNDLEKTVFLRGGVGRAFLFLWPVYGMIGARTHSLKILEMALSLGIKDEAKDWCREDMDLIRKELLVPENKALDDIWESFLQGKNRGFWQKLYDVCIDKGAPEMARRVELLDLDRKTGKIDVIGIDEIFRLVRPAVENGKEVGKVLL